MNIKKYILLLMALVFSAVFRTTVHAADTIYVVPFYPIDTAESLAENLGEALSEQKLDGISVRYDEDAKAINPLNEDDVKKAVAKARTQTASHVLCGSVERSYGDGYLIKNILIPLQDTKRIYKTEYFIQNESHLREAAKIIAGRIGLEIKGTGIGNINGIKAKADEEKSVIAVSWEKRQGVNEYAVYRSPVENGPFIKIADVSGETLFTDTGAIRGIEYCYGVAAIIEGIPGNPGETVTAHLRMPAPRGLKIEEEKKKKTVSDKQIARELKNEVVRKHLEFLSDYYMHPVKLNLALYLGRSYIEKGQVIALSDFESQEINPEQKRIKLVGKEKGYVVEMEAASFFGFLAKAEERKVPEVPALIDRLLKNAIAYALLRGETKLKDEYGHTVFVPYYEAIGMSTEYFKNYAKWENNTLMMSTSDKELKKKMKEAQEKGGKIE